MGKLLTIMLTCLCFTSIGQTYSKLDNPTKCKNQIRAKTLDSKTIQGNFKETIYSSMFNNPKYAKGKLLYAEPNKIRWEHTENKDQIILINGTDMRMRENGHEVNSLGNQQIMKKIQSLMMQLLNGDFLNEKDFRITYYKNTNYYKLILKPKSNRVGKYISSVIMIFDIKSCQLKSLTLKETEEDRIEYEFSQLVFNTLVSGTKFEKF